MEERYLAALDIGTTTVRCYIFNSRAEIVGRATDQVILHYPHTGYVEIDPDELWKSIVGVVDRSLEDGKLTAGQLTSMGLSTQRSTFITWSQSTGQPFHRFITWKDLRADKLVKQWNDSITWKAMRAGSLALYLLLRSKRFRAGSVLKLMNTQTTLRLAWALEHVEGLKAAVRKSDAVFGTLDTWLLHKLTEEKTAEHVLLQCCTTRQLQAELLPPLVSLAQVCRHPELVCEYMENIGGRLHVTDVSSASATGLFDPFTMSWASWALGLFSIPANILPDIVDTAGEHFTSTEKDIWGTAIPIRSSMADQTAAMWGSCCFEPGDVKLTMGTGTFLNINTGGAAHASVSGLYPLVGWRLSGELVYMAEGANNDTGSIVKWAQNTGLFKNPEDTSAIATSVPNSDGVYFVPAFSGLGPPHNDATCGSGYIGVKASSTQAHLVRALLESIAFRIHHLYRCVRLETHYNLHTIRLDGGVANNDFMAQLISDLSGLRVERPVHTEMSALGCAYITGLQLGVWKSKEELKSLHKIGRVFTPRAHVQQRYEGVIARWDDAIKRFSGWYEQASPPPPGAAVSDLNVEPSSPSSNLKVKSRINGKKKDAESLSK